MTTIAHHRKDLRIEAQFLPDSLGDLLALRPRLVAMIATGEVDGIRASSADTVADGIVGWLVAKAAGETDTLTASTRSRYRRILGQLAEQEPPGGRRRDAGRARLGVVAGGGVVAGLAASGHPVLALVAAPIIYGDDVTSTGLAAA